MYRSQIGLRTLATFILLLLYDRKHISFQDMKGKRKEKSNGGLEIKLILVLCLEIKLNPGVVFN